MSKAKNSFYIIRMEVDGTMLPIAFDVRALRTCGVVRVETDALSIKTVSFSQANLFRGLSTVRYALKRLQSQVRAIYPKNSRFRLLLKRIPINKLKKHDDWKNLQTPAFKKLYMSAQKAER
jgi:hypothetical protein